MMLRTLVAAVILLFAGRARASPQNDAKVRAELIALDDAWIKAEVGHDRPALEHILDEQFLATFKSGKTLDRTAYIDYVLTAEAKPFRVTHDVIHIHDDTALVIDLSEGGNTKFIYVAIKRAGQWRVISETFSAITKP